MKSPKISEKKKVPLLLDALKGANESRAPVWLMRQAGRYLPEYQALRKNYSLRTLFFSPELAAKVTLMPIQTLGVDATILFSDITVVALALGFELDFQEGPVITPLLETASDVQNLPCYDVRDVLAPIGETVSLALSDVPLIGFCGGPFTVASYLIEKHAGSNLVKTKRWLEQDPESFHLLLEKITTVSIDYLRMQVEKGAEAIQIFDSWAHVLTDKQFEIVCLPYWKRLLDATSASGIVFGRKNSLRIEQIAAIQPAAISIDWLLPMAEAREKTNLALQGNLDPDLLFAPLPEIREKTLQLLDSMRSDPGFIVNLGHGIKPGSPLDAVRCVVDTVKNYVP
ncbi:MAG: uroporphyrinogen decarboxylase [Chlamydiae bacterium]|nr:uroporphyrinogen decarboxylase [Chlamydiota bacterium]